MTKIEINKDNIKLMLEVNEEDGVIWTEGLLDMFINALRGLGYYPGKLEELREELV